jgi:hypothetical protein
MTVAQALEAVRRAGTVQAAEGKLKLVFPTRMRDSLTPALAVLRQNRMEALALVDQKTTPGDGEQHWQIWDEWKAAMLNRLFELRGVLGEPGRIAAATVRHGRLQEPEAKDHPMGITAESFDRAYWGPNGIDLSRWGPACGRGMRSRSISVRAFACPNHQPTGAG